MTNNIKTFRELIDIIDPHHDQIPFYYIKSLIDVDAFRKNKTDYYYISQKFINYQDIKNALEEVEPVGTLKEIQEQYINAFRRYIHKKNVLGEENEDISDIIFQQGSGNKKLNTTTEGLIVYLKSLKEYDRKESDKDVYERVVKMFDKYYEKHFEWLKKYDDLISSIKILPEDKAYEIRSIFLESIADINIKKFIINARLK